MKKIIVIIISIFLIIFIGTTIYKWTITKHHISYELDGYKIEEYYQKKEKDTYHLFLSKGKEFYSTTIQSKTNKKKQIVTSIKKVKSGNIICIIPTYYKDIEKNILCLEDKKQVSIDYLIKKNDEDFVKIQEKLKKEKLEYPSSSETKTSYKRLNVYNHNIKESEVFYIWNYKGIYILSSKENHYEKILDYDLYDNILTCTVKDRFVLLENNSVKGIKNIYYYDYKKNKLKVAKLEKVISKDSYINGINNNLIYITDRKLKREYTLDIEKEKLAEIDEEETVYKTFHNGKEKELSKSDFFLETQTFGDTSNDVVSYYLEDNKIYKVYHKEKKHPILLLELENIKDWKIKGEEILILKEDTLYAYHEKYGLRKIVENKEFQYNYKNIYQMGEV